VTAIPHGNYDCGCAWRGLKAPPRCPTHGKRKKEVSQSIAAVTSMVERLKQRNLKAIRESSEYRR